MKASALRPVIGVALILASLTACQRSASKFIELGNAAAKSGKLADAEINYRNAIQKEPGNFQAHYRLAVTARQRGNGKLALDAISRAVELNSREAEALALQADICWDGYMADPHKPKRLHEQVALLADRLLELNPNSPEGLRFKGLTALAERKPVIAAEFFRRAADLRPGDPDLVLARAQCLLLIGESAEASRLLTGIIASRKEYFPAYDTLYGYLLESRRPADAEKILVLKTGNNPAEPSFLLQLAEHYSRQGNLGARDRTLARLTSNLSQFPDAWLRVGNFFFERADWPQAQRAFEEGLRARPAEPVVFRRRIASTLAASGKAREAQSLLDELLRERPDDRELLSQRASLRSAIGDSSGAIADLRRAVERHPSEPATRNLLARTYADQGDLASAVGEYGVILKGQPLHPEALIGSAEVLTKQLRFSDAAGYVDRYLEIRPADHRALLLRAVILIGTKDTPAAISDLRKLLAANPNDREAAMQLGLVYTSQSRFTEAEALFSKFVQPGDRDARPTLGIARIRVLQGRVDDALRLLQSRLRQAAHPRLLRQEIATIALQAGRRELAIEELVRLTNETPADPELLRQLARTYLDVQETAKALDLLSRARKIAPNRPELVVLQAIALQQAGRTREADQAFRAALELSPGDPGLLNNFGYFLSESGASLDEALAHAQKAVQDRPDVPQFSHTLGWILLKKHETEKAVQTFRALVRDHPDNPQFRHHLGLALIQGGDHAAARTELMAALKSKPEPAETSQIRRALEALPR